MLLAAGLTAGAQRSNIWYFGATAGLDFNAVTAANPLPVSLENSAMQADEGCSSICDNNGAILFYTNGVNIYNKRHLLMVNGDNIGGNISAFQSSVIIPFPGDPDKYYVFTADAFEDAFLIGYRYSIVDMTGDNGNGVVTTKNIPLWAPGTERLTATRHANGTDVWVITNDFNSNTFRAWLINCNGLQPAPVVSQAGDVLDAYDVINVGALRVSPDGKHLCQTHFADINVPGSSSPYDYFQLFDFNAQTGALSNPQKIYIAGSRFVNAEFSSNSRLLYVTHNGEVDQFDITQPTTAGIINSKQSFTASGNIFGIQLGPDKKIYLSPGGYTIDVIANPDAAGAACQYQKKQLVLTRNAKLAFPSFISDVAADPFNNFTYTITDSCTGTVQFNATSNLSGAINYAWDFGDGQFSNLQNPVHTFNPPKQSYTVKLVISSALGCGVINRSKTFIPSGIVGKPAFQGYGGCDSGYIRVENRSPLAPGSNVVYEWDFGDGFVTTAPNPKHFYTQAGIYPIKLRMLTTTPCLNDSMTQFADMQTMNGSVTITPDKTIFLGQSIVLSATGPGNQFAWSPATSLSNANISNPIASPASDITYTVKISNAVGCFVERSVSIKVVDLDGVYVPTGFTPNGDGNNDLLKPLFGTKYQLLEFSIYNRWGQHLFTTATTGAGWDGSFGGKKADQDVYVWVLKVKDSTGKLIERKGTVVLIR